MADTRFRPSLVGLGVPLHVPALTLLTARGLSRLEEGDPTGAWIYGIGATFVVTTFVWSGARIVVEVRGTTVRVRTPWRPEVVFHRGATVVRRHRWDAGWFGDRDPRHAMRLTDTTTGRRRTVDLRCFRDHHRLDAEVSAALDAPGPTFTGPPDAGWADGISGPPRFREP